MAGQGVSFNGSTDYMNFGSASSLDDIELQGGGGMTVSVWVKREQDIINENLIGKGYLYGGWHLTFSASQLRFRRYYDTTSINCFSDTGYSDGPWMHVVFTWTGSADMPGGVEFYKNGAVVSKVSCSQDGVGNKPSDGTRSLVAGIYESDLSSDPFLGDMDDIRIYNSVITATQVADLYRASGAKEISNANHREALTDGLVGYWTFDGRDVNWGDTSTEIKDISGNANHGAVSGLTRSSVRAGKLGQGLQFNGTSDYVDLNSGIIGTGTYTFCTWVKAPLFVSPNAPLGNAYPFWFGLGSAGVSGQIWAFISNNDTGTMAESGYFSENVWNHVCAIRNSNNTATLYVNGVQSGTANQAAGTISPVLTNFLLAKQNGGSNYYTGLLDDFRVYDRALSTTEIANLYNVGK